MLDTTPVEPSVPLASLILKMRGVLRLRNANIIDPLLLFNCYMFRSYDHLQVDIFSRIYSTDKPMILTLRRRKIPLLRSHTRNRMQTPKINF
jgi:hypothetical protein